MRKWIPVALIVLVVLWYILQNAGSSMALSDAFARPLQALHRNGTSVPVQQPGASVANGMAHPVGGAGIQFGYSFVYRLPDGSTVTCLHRFRSLSCDGGWTPERASQ
ncbi:MAG: hypothetical protein MUE52_07680 [Tabrizicola sp.]|jgi:hypothetical protein|nr:hypothetical protein [Tabrizicola sp.]